MYKRFAYIESQAAAAPGRSRYQSPLCPEKSHIIADKGKHVMNAISLHSDSLVVPCSDYNQKITYYEGKKRQTLKPSKHFEMWVW